LKPIALLGSGMVTGVGLNAPASCAAIRCGLNNFVETRFMDSAGEWITGTYVPLEQPWRGRAKLVHLVVPAIRECLDQIKDTPFEQVPLFLCVAEKERPGRLDGLDDLLLEEIQAALGLRFNEMSNVIAKGRIGGAEAIKQARTVMSGDQLRYSIVAGVDTYLIAETLLEFEKKDRILTGKNSNGFIPGEAAAALLLSPENAKIKNGMVISGIGFGEEKATVDSEEPLRADGLVQAIKQALGEAKVSLGDVNYRITSVNGEQYWFKEAALALTRILRERKEEFDIWHAVDSIGEVGAAIVPCSLGVALAAASKKYTPGNRVLCHFSNDDGLRATMILSSHM
jgi:3-oxoacyl-[acyl-carrier-protein] synthase I